MLEISLVPLADNAAMSNDNAGPNIGRRHLDAFEVLLSVQSDNGSPVGITQDDLRTHIDKFVHEEEAAFEHLLVDEDGSFCLCCNRPARY